MLAYIYVGDYDERPNASREYDKDSSVLLNNVAVAICADKYGLEHLRSIALDRIKKLPFILDPSFFRAAEEVFHNSSEETNKALREVFLSACWENIDT